MTPTVHPTLPVVLSAAEAADRLRALARCVAFAAAFALAVAASRRAEAAASLRRWETHTYAMIALGRALVADLGEARSALRDARVTGDPAHLARAESGRERFRIDLDEIRRRTADNPAQRANLADLERKAAALFRRLDAGDTDAIGEFEATRPAIGRVIDEETRLLAGRTADADEASRRVAYLGRLAVAPVFLLAVDALVRAVLPWLHRLRAGVGGVA